MRLLQALLARGPHPAVAFAGPWEPWPLGLAPGLRGCLAAFAGPLGSTPKLSSIGGPLEGRGGGGAGPGRLPLGLSALTIAWFRCEWLQRPASGGPALALAPPGQPGVAAPATFTGRPVARLRSLPQLRPVLFRPAFDPTRVCWQTTDAGLAWSGCWSRPVSLAAVVLVHPTYQGFGQRGGPGAVASPWPTAGAWRVVVDEAHGGPFGAAGGWPAKLLAGPGLGGRADVVVAVVAPRPPRRFWARGAVVAACRGQTGSSPKAALGVACSGCQDLPPQCLFRLRWRRPSAASQSAAARLVAGRALAFAARLRERLEDSWPCRSRQFFRDSAPSGAEHGPPWASKRAFGGRRLD